MILQDAGYALTETTSKRAFRAIDVAEQLATLAIRKDYCRGLQSWHLILQGTGMPDERRHIIAGPLSVGLVNRSMSRIPPQWPVKMGTVVPNSV